MQKNIKFKTIESFVNYPHDEIISSSGFAQLDKPVPQVNYKEDYKKTALNIIKKELKTYQERLEAGMSVSIDDDKNVINEIKKVIALYGSDEFEPRLDYLANFSDELADEILEESYREILEIDGRNSDNGNDYSKKSHLVTMIGDDKYEIYISDCRDCEGLSYLEQWKKNGVLHRYGGGAAETKINSYNIPEEKYLGEHVLSFCIDGKEIKRVDGLTRDQKREVEIHSMLGLGVSRKDIESELAM